MNKNINYKEKEARHPFNPFKGKPKKPTDKDIELLREWAKIDASVRASYWESVGYPIWDSVWDSVGGSVTTSVWSSVGGCVTASIWSSVGDSARDSVWDSVRAYFGSLFLNIKKWKGIDHKEGEYPFQPAVDLWYIGFVPAFDGEKWQLLSGKRAEVVWEGKIE